MQGGDKGKEAETDTNPVHSIPPLVPMGSRGLLPLPREHGGGETTHIEVQCRGYLSRLLTKLELSVFGGQDAKGWLNKCGKYFEVYEEPIDRRVYLAS